MRWAWGKPSKELGYTAALILAVVLFGLTMYLDAVDQAARIEKLRAYAGDYTMSTKQTTTTVILTDTHRAMLKVVLALSPGAPSTYMHGLGWLIEEAYHRAVPSNVRDTLGLKTEHEPPAVQPE